MRELSLLETGYLAALLVASLVLPLMLSFRNPRQPVVRRACLRAVWVGQGVGFLAGIGILTSSTLAPVATVLGLLTVGVCAVVLQRQSLAMQSV